MEKLDRLGWAAGLTFTTFGVRIGVRVTSTELLDLASSVFPAGSKVSASRTVERLYSVVGGSTRGGDSSRRFFLLYGNVARLARTLNSQELYEIWQSDMDFYIAQRAPRKLFVHAGVVAWKGHAIVIPGRSHSGKTTLVKAFLQAGATYYSDEFAVFDERGRVHPFPRPLSVRTLNTTRKITPEELGSLPGTGPIPTGLIMLTHYDAGVRWRPRQTSSGRAILGLLANTLAARRQPEGALATLAQVASGAQVLQGTRGEARETVESIVYHWGKKV